VGNNSTLTLREVAELLKVCPKTVRRWVALGKLPAPIRPGGGKPLWVREAIEAWLAQAHAKAQAQAHAEAQAQAAGGAGAAGR
jgi:excisionase family DNA binding protein